MTRKNNKKSNNKKISENNIIMYKVTFNSNVYHKKEYKTGVLYIMSKKDVIDIEKNGIKLNKIIID